jgi:hypothetical protein
MNRAHTVLLSAALLLAGCGPSTPTAEIKVDPATEGWYGETTARLTKINHDAAFLIQNKRTDDAAALINAGVPMQARLLTAPRPTLEAMEAVADLDDLYGRMLVADGKWGSARMLFQKNVTRWKSWKQKTPETEERLKQANDAIAECDKHMGA